MQENELKELLASILEKKAETSNIEFKSAKEGAPEIAEMDAKSKPCFYAAILAA